MKRADRGSYVDGRPSRRISLAGLWTTLMVLYLYCDFLSLYKPGQIAEIGEGLMGVLRVDQTSLVIAALLMIIPALMIALSLELPARWSRIVNAAAAILYFLVNIGNLLGEQWAYYLVFGILELGITTLIAVLALRWPREGE